MSLRFFNRNGNVFLVFLALFALPLHSAENDNGGEGSNCSSSKDCNTGLVCSSDEGICVTEVVEEIVVTAERPSPAVVVVLIVPPNNYPFPSSQPFPGG